MAPSHSSPPSRIVSSENAKPFACTACAQRKVKCDKRQPCLACVRSRLPCQYRDTPPPQRRKRKLEDPNQALLDRLRSHEATLRNAGLPFEPTEDITDAVDDQNEAGEEATENLDAQPLPAHPIESANTALQTPIPHRGILLPEYGGKRYYEYGLIGTLGLEYSQGQTDDVVPQHEHGERTCPEGLGLESQTSDLLTSAVVPLPSSARATLSPQHPPSDKVVEYWSTFVTNVHPLTKVIHVPTIHQTVLGSSPNLSKSTDALRFSIYACAVASLTDRECRRTFGDSRTSLLSSFQSATRHALVESHFLKVPNLDLLRANVLLLTSMLHSSDASSLWVVMGSATRLAQSQGLHRDGAALGLSQFEVEMRRRLWWYIITLDGRITELMGSENSLPKSMDTPLPTNCNDADLDPVMTTPPQERQGASEMTFCLLQYEITRFLQKHDPRPSGSQPLQSQRNGRPGEKRSISDLESMLEHKFLRFCDPVIPVQFLTTTLGRSTICKLRQLARHRRSRHNPDDAQTMTVVERNKTLNIAARNVEYDNLIHCSKSLRGFLWYVDFYFPWGAPIFMLTILASRTEWDADMQAAWSQIEEFHENHPEFVESRKVVHLIVGGLTFKAWAAREAAMESRGIVTQRRPPIVTALGAKHEAAFMQHIDFGTLPTGEDFNFADMVGTDMITPESFDLGTQMMAGIDWLNWGS